MADELTLEQLITREVGPAIREAIHKKLASEYRSPLDGIITRVIDANAADIQGRLDAALKTAIAAADFEAAVRDNLTHKLARVLSSKMEGAVEKVANDVRSNPAFRARLTIAAEGILKELGETVGRAK